MRTINKHCICILRLIVFAFLTFGAVMLCPLYGASSWLFTSDHDLPNSLINDLVEDADGNVWIATEDGLCRYNGATFTTYLHQAGEAHSLRHNLVRCLFVDKEGHLLVGTMEGVQLYRPETDDFSLPAKAEDNTIWPGNIAQIGQDSRGTLYVCGNVSCYLRVVEESELELYFSPLTYKVNLTQCMVEDNEGVFWLCHQYREIYRLLPNDSIERVVEDGHGVVSSILCLGDDGAMYMAGEREGLFRFDTEKQRFVLVSDPKQHFVVSTLRNTGDGKLLVGTDGNGLFVFDLATQQLSPYYFDSYQLAPSTQKVHAVLLDSNRSLWLGLYQKGVLVSMSQNLPFRYIGHKTELHNGIGDKCVTSIIRSVDGNVWVSTDNGGIFCIDHVGTPIRQFAHSTRADGIPQSVMTIYEDSKRRFWFGSFHRGLGQMDRNTGRCTYYNIRGQQEAANVYGFVEDDEHRLWAASMGMGPLLWDEKSKEMVPVSEDYSVMWSTSVIYDEYSHHLFFGSYNGLNEMDPHQKPFKFEQHLENYVIHSVSKFDSTTLCLCTDVGLLLYNYKTKDVKTFTTADGLPSNAVYAAAAVSDTEVWVSCNRGLSRLQLPEGEVNSYTIFDGLQSNEFYKNAYMVEPDGTLWFGGMEGITFFNPQEIGHEMPTFKVRVTQRTDHTIEMAVVPLLYTYRARYSYSLDGSKWATLPYSTNVVALSNLGYGDHTFRYYASVDGVASEERCYQFHIDYPWYRQWWFEALCVLFALTFIVEGLLHAYHRRRDKKRLAEHERLEAINDAKLHFFTNISHEIRTPMTLIVSPLERLLAEETDSQRRRTFQLMQRNATRILGLINQMLDLRKIDKNQMQLLCAETDLVPYLEELVNNFSDVAEMHQQSLHFVSERASLTAWVDVANFDKIVVNLLSNALKYTPQKGSIEVSLTVNAPNESFAEGSFTIAVADTGIGIAPADREHIFERFYQVQSSKGKYGTGIGLHLTRMLVQLHHGTIAVTDNPSGVGSLFTVTLPLGNRHLTPEQMTVLEAHEQETESTNSDVSTIAAASLTNESDDRERSKHLTRRHVLVVDDDEEMRTYIAKHLSEYYYVSQCVNGREAFERILQHAPDLVISDVMMPEMDGNELCRRIRNNVLVSHVPVILLTARSSQQDHIQGLDVGADGFLPKPFNVDVLARLAQNVIRNHERLKNAYSGQQDQTAHVEVVRDKTPDERLMERINRVLNEHISDPNLSAEMVATEVGLSRVHLYRKLKELTNQSARDYIRNMRIIKAAELLTGKAAVGEVAAKVGYTDQRNFSTAFKSIYGMTPTEYMERHLNASETSSGDSETASSVSSGTL